MAVRYLLNIQYSDGGFHYAGSQFVACICFTLSSLSLLKVSYLLHEDPTPLLAPTNQPQIKCEKIQLNNSFESIPDEDVPFSIVAESITVEETRDIFKVFIILLCIFLYIYSYIFDLIN